MRPRDKVIRYQVHAKQRMRGRGITEGQVEQTIRKPDRTASARRPGATRFERRLSTRRTIVVVAEKHAMSFWVITAWMK